MEIDEIIRWQRKRQFLWRSVPFEGRDIKLGALAFRVYPGVSWPFEDSLPLIENMCINQGDSVLDVGTGTGNIAIHAALKGAGRVLALDRNSAAVAAARENAKRHGVSDRIEARGSDVFSALGNERFDVITANLPWLNKSARDEVESAQWDSDFQTNRKFFMGLQKYLKHDGRVYYSQGNYGALDAALNLMHEAGFTYQIIGEARSSTNTGLIYYAFELRLEEQASVSADTADHYQ